MSSAEQHSKTDAASQRSESARVEEHLPLAQIIACEYVNTPNTTLDELISEAHCALLRATKKFDPSRGRFESYAARAIRNALNDFYEAQMRRAAMFPISLDASPETSSSESSLSSKIADPAVDVVIEARRNESRQAFEDAVAKLPPRLGNIVTGLGSGWTYQELGVFLGLSKQGVHKLAQPALRKLREHLAERGLTGVDSRGFLRSQKSAFADEPDRATDASG